MHPHLGPFHQELPISLKLNATAAQKMPVPSSILPQPPCSVSQLLQQTPSSNAQTTSMWAHVHYPRRGSSSPMSRHNAQMEATHPEGTWEIDRQTLDGWQP